MDKSYIIRIYEQENKSVIGVIEDIEQNKRFGFSSADELWKLIANNWQGHTGIDLNKDEISPPSTTKAS
ncbi:MAG: hypothetical protein KAT90_01400 [Gammaproteobacteria bacterium]|nr:hypothetical protein [Gammaproteobacteria bacterium]